MDRLITNFKEEEMRIWIKYNFGLFITYDRKKFGSLAKGHNEREEKLVFYSGIEMKKNKMMSFKS
jgi:hypothetical protein